MINHSKCCRHQRGEQTGNTQQEFQPIKSLQFCISKFGDSLSAAQRKLPQGVTLVEIFCNHPPINVSLASANLKNPTKCQRSPCMILTSFLLYSSFSFVLFLADKVLC